MIIRRTLIGLATTSLSVFGFVSNASAQTVVIESPAFDAAVQAAASELLKDIKESRGYSDSDLMLDGMPTYSNSSYTLTDVYADAPFATDLTIGSITFNSKGDKLPGGTFQATIKLVAKLDDNGGCSVASGTYKVVKSSNPLVQMMFQQDINDFGDQVVEAFLAASEIKTKYCPLSH